MLYTTLISIIVFTLYLGVTLLRFQTIPPSLSDTYYKWGTKGWIFTISMCVTAALMLPAMIAVGEGNVWQFLGFLSPASLVFVGVAPRFKTDLTETKIHCISALICGTSAILWCILAVHLWWVLLISFAVIAGAFYFTSRKSIKTIQGCIHDEYTFWVEMWAFLSAFLALLIAL